VTGSADDRSTIAQAWAWSSRVTTVALEMTLPAAAGYWIDQKLGHRLIFLVLGATLGMILGLVSLVRMTTTSKTDGPSGRTPSNDREDNKP